MRGSSFVIRVEFCVPLIKESEVLCITGVCYFLPLYGVSTLLPFYPCMESLRYYLFTLVWSLFLCIGDVESLNVSEYTLYCFGGSVILWTARHLFFLCFGSRPLSARNIILLYRDTHGEFTSIFSKLIVG